MRLILHYIGILSFFQGGHLENHPKWRAGPNISSVNILILNQGPHEQYYMTPGGSLGGAWWPLRAPGLLRVMRIFTYWPRTDRPTYGWTHIVIILHTCGPCNKLFCIPVADNLKINKKWSKYTMRFKSYDHFHIWPQLDRLMISKPSFTKKAWLSKPSSIQKSQTYKWLDNNEMHNMHAKFDLNIPCGSRTIRMFTDWPQMDGHMQWL